MSEVPPASRDSSSGSARRGFLAGLISLLVGLVPTGLAGAFFLSPLFRRRQDEAGFISLGVSVDALPADGTPQMVTVVKDKIDKWNMYPKQPVGTVWLRRVGDDVVAYNTICPHLGCTVEHRAADNDFYCPCHESTFDLDGERQNQIPPRGMDRLEVQLDDGAVSVKYVNFRAGENEKNEI